MSPLRRGDDLHFGAVQVREQLGIQHVVHRRVVRMPVQQIDGAGQDRQQHIEIVRDDLDRHAELLVEPCQHMHHGALAGQVEIRERLVEHEQFRIAYQGLRDGDALAQTARKLGQPVVGLVGDAGEGHGLLHLRALRLGDEVDAETGAGQAEQHRLLGGEIGVDVRSVALRHVPDLAVHLACRASEHMHGAPGEWEEAELRFHHRGFAGAVRADYGGDRTRRYGEVAVLPDQPFAAFHRGVAEHDAVGPLFLVAAVAVHMIHRPVCTGPASRPPVRHVRQRIIAKDYDNHSH